VSADEPENGEEDLELCTARPGKTRQKSMDVSGPGPPDDYISYCHWGVDIIDEFDGETGVESMIFVLGMVTFSQREWDGSLGVIDSKQEIERRIGSHARQFTSD
jgi:hypothetical protein